MNGHKDFEDGDITSGEVEDLLMNPRSPEPVREAFDIFYDPEMAEQEKRRLINEMADAGDSQAIGYLEAFGMMDAGKRIEAAEKVDTQVGEICSAVADRMTQTGLSGFELRERNHLDPFIKDEIEKRSGARPVSRKYKSDAFHGLGAVDVVAEDPKVMMELKWSYALPGKVFESVWDAIKLALLGPVHGFENLYVATGASRLEWDASESADLFETGDRNPTEMWERNLAPPRGPNNGATVGEDLVIGARGNQPTSGPKLFRVLALGAFEVAQDFELRLARVEGVTRLRDWPQIAYP